MSNGYEQLPSVDRVLRNSRLEQAVSELGTSSVTQAVRDELDVRRTAIAQGGAIASHDEIAQSAARRAYASLGVGLRPVINATGVIIHTNLGRPPIAESAIAAMAEVSRGYSNLEYDLDTGERGSRYVHLETLLCRLTGAEAAMAVNNNASALLLTLSALAQDAEVVISRGQLIEIGGGFRIPDVMAQSGARLVEVGTTNRTYLRDYEAALNESTVALMRVHTSNYRIIGFTASPDLGGLAELAHAHGLVLIDDVGSGCLLDTRGYGLVEEPRPQESIEAGADLVLFSGDKLLGGPQAGIIAGRKSLIDRLKRHPLARALRLDKATIAGLNATLMHYVRGDAERSVPVWRMIALTAAETERRASQWAQAVGWGEVMEGRSMIGGGSLPEESLPTFVLAIEAPDLDEVARRLRLGTPSVVGRIEHARLLLDPRTVHPEQDEDVVRALRVVMDSLPAPGSASAP